MAAALGREAGCLQCHALSIITCDSHYAPFPPGCLPHGQVMSLIAYPELSPCLLLLCPSLSQVMSLIAYLMENKQNFGPHLIIVPNAGGRVELGGVGWGCVGVGWSRVAFALSGAWS